MRRLCFFLLGVALWAQAQTLCFSSPATCPQTPIRFLLPQSAVPALAPPRVVMPALKPVVPLELSPETEPFFLTGHADLAFPTSSSGGVSLAPVPAYGGSTAGAYGASAAPETYPGSAGTGVEVPHLSGGSGGGVTVNTGFGPH